jgi:hypothetical protein
MHAAGALVLVHAVDRPGLARRSFMSNGSGGQAILTAGRSNPATVPGRSVGSSHPLSTVQEGVKPSHIRSPWPPCEGGLQSSASPSSRC